MLSYLFGKAASMDTSTATTPTQLSTQPQTPPPSYTATLDSCKCDPCTCEICECPIEQDSEVPVENCKVIRGKFMYDDCSTIEEMIHRLREQIEFLKTLQDEGWNVSGITKDDYTFMHREITG